MMLPTHMLIVNTTKAEMASKPDHIRVSAKGTLISPIYRETMSAAVFPNSRESSIMNTERNFNPADTLSPFSGNKVNRWGEEWHEVAPRELMAESQEKKRQEMGGNEWEAQSEWSITVGCAGHSEQPRKEATRLSPPAPKYSAYRGTRG